MAPQTPQARALHLELRSATQELHHRLDSHRVLTPLVSPSITVPQYQQALLALHAIGAPVEERIGEYVAAHSLPLDFGSWRRISDLVRDLDFYGLAPCTAAWDGPRIASDAGLIGNLYVLAGSAIGGRAIFTQVNKSLGITEERGGRFFYGYGNRLARIWREFWEFAAGHCPEGKVPEACDAAGSLFRSYLELLEGKPC